MHRLLFTTLHSFSESKRFRWKCVPTGNVVTMILVESFTQPNQKIVSPIQGIIKSAMLTNKQLEAANSFDANFRHYFIMSSYFQFAVRKLAPTPSRSQIVRWPLTTGAPFVQICILIFALIPTFNRPSCKKKEK